MSARSRTRLALLFDPVEENWPSMDLVGDELLRELAESFAAQVDPRRVAPAVRRIARRLPRLGARAAFNADRVWTRFLEYPLRAAALRGAFDQFHVVDHSYAQLVHALPAERTGVFCHDLDAFRSVVQPPRERRPAWFRAMARAVLAGLQRAAVVFHSTAAVRREIEALGLLDPARLVHAPYGVAREFVPDGDPRDGAAEVLAPLGGRPFVLHVGSAIPRKRLDVLFRVFARVRERVPELALVQQGGALDAAQRRLVEDLGLRDALLQPPKLPRRTLAGLYRRAALVLVPSDAEGFGFPVIEALACGSAVIASSIPPCLEVGGDAATYAPAGDVEAWARAALRALDDPSASPPRARRLERASRFTWRAHADTIVSAYRRLAVARSS